MARDYAPVLTSILSAAASAFNEADRPAGLVHLAPGQAPAWDACCADGGQLYLRLVEVYPTAGAGGAGGGGGAFPSMDVDQRGIGSGCGVRLLALHLALGVIRCAAVLDDEGNPPPAVDMSADTVNAVTDMATMLDVLVCAVPAVAGVARAKVGRWVPQGVQGGCHGGEWTFYVAVDPCLTC